MTTNKEVTHTRHTMFGCRQFSGWVTSPRSVRLQKSSNILHSFTLCWCDLQIRNTQIHFFYLYVHMYFQIWIRRYLHREYLLIVDRSVDIRLTVNHSQLPEEKVVNIANCYLVRRTTRFGFWSVEVVFRNVCLHWSKSFEELTLLLRYRHSVNGQTAIWKHAEGTKILKILK